MPRKLLTLLVAGLVVCLSTAPAAAAPAGSLDRSFSNDGKTTIGFEDEYDFVKGHDVLITSSGKVVMVAAVNNDSYHSTTKSRFGVVRLRENGTSDSSFSSNGRLATKFTGNDVPRRVVSRGKGRILVGGSAGDAFGLAAYRRDGRLDSTFSDNGKVRTNITDGMDQILDLQVKRDGSILAAGKAGDQFAVARYRRSGKLDTTFGNDGVVLTTDGFDGHAVTVRLQPDGKFLAAGMTEEAGNLRKALSISRFDADGSLDESFGGGDGRVRRFIPNRDAARAHALLVQPSGGIIVGGVTFGPGEYSYALLARFYSGGGLDKSFAGKGYTEYFEPYYSYFYALARQPDGKIVAAGDAGGVLSVVRYTEDGKPDKSFGKAGARRVGFGKEGATAYAVTSRKGRIVAVGERIAYAGKSSTGVIARLHQ